jgi:hypothetical protein
MTWLRTVTPFTVLALSLALGFVLALGGCETQPVRYADVATTTYLAPNDGADSETVPYRYAAASVDWRSYTKVIVDPVAIYQGPDQQFGSLSEAEKETLARTMQAQFTERLKKRFTVTHVTGPNTIRVRLTLTGAETNMAVLSTLSRFDIAGGIYNGLQAVRGREGALTGSVNYVAEIIDASTSRLLYAYIAKQYPGPYDLGATIGPLAAAEAGIDKGAKALIEGLK